MKHVILTTLVVAVIVGLNAKSDTEIVDGYTWSYYNGIIYADGGLTAISPYPTGHLTIPNTLGGKPVTCIGNLAFDCCSALTSITIPDSVTSIGDSAFLDCSGLTSIVIPDGVTSIGTSAFSGCSGLRSITIPNSVTSIGDGAFNDCSELTSITIPDGVTNIGGFSGCSKLTSITIPNGVTSIGGGAFSGCSNLTSITIPNSVTNIGDEAFTGCSRISNATIPGRFELSVFQQNKNKSIRVTIALGSAAIVDGAFKGYSNLQSITIPDSVSSIGNNAFSGCSGLTSITMPTGVTSIGDYAFNGCSGLTSITIPNGVTNIGVSMFQNCSKLRSITIPNEVTNIGERAFYNCSRLASIVISANVMSVGDKAFYGCSEIKDVVIPGRFKLSTVFPSAYSSITNAVVAERSTSLVTLAFDGCSRLKSITIPESVTSIGSAAFDRCSSLAETRIKLSDASAWATNTINANLKGVRRLFVGEEEVTEVFVPDGVTNVGAYAFSLCSGLTSVTISDHVTSIGNYAFNGCSGLSSIIIPDSVTSIGDYAFNGCSGLASITIPDSVTNIGNHAFAECSGLTSVTIPDSVTNIGASAFSGCSGLTSITIPNGVTSIGNAAFSGCSGLTSITIPNGVTSIENAAFYGCSELTSITIPNTVTSIGVRVFSGCSGLTSVALPDSVTSIGWDSFSGCSGLTSITIPDSVTSIETWTFSGCSGLTSVTIPDSVKSIGWGAFSGCSGLTSIAIPDSVTSIDGWAFFGCSGLTSVTIPVSVTNIANGAFADCTGLKTVSVSSLYGCERFAELFPEIADSVECVGFLDGVTAIPDDFFEGCTSLRTMDLAESVVDIGTNVFEACSALETVVSNGLEVCDGWVIGMANGAAAPADLAIPEGTRGIASNAFAGEWVIGTLVLPETLRFVGARAFKDCTSLESIAMPEGVAKIDREAFRNCTYAQGLALPGTLREIGDGAFANESMLVGATLPDGVISVGACAFSNCWRMLSVALPQSVERVGDGAFADCRRVAGVTVPLHVRPMSELFPAAYSNLETVTIASTDGSLGELAPPEAEAWLASRQMVPDVFKGCAALEEIELPTWVRNVSDGAFEGCAALTEIGIPAAVTNLGEQAFAGCGTLSAVALPKNLEELRDGTFAGCASIAEIVVPESVRRFGNGIFSGCTLLRSVRFVGNAPAYGAADGGPYTGVPAGAKSYVANGSKGWDGIATSMALPEYWPAGTTYEIAFWTPNRFDAAFDPNHGGEPPVEVEQVTGTSYVLPPDPVRPGARFSGWWTAPENGARVTASMQVTATRPLTFYAHWTMNHYWVRFDANGGSGTAEPVEMTVGTPVALPPCPFTKIGNSFAGWATEPGGEVVYVDGAEVADLAYAQNAAVTLYAVWQAREWTLADYLDAPGLAFGTASGGEWGPDLDDAKAGGASLRCDGLPPAAAGGRTNAMLRAAVTGAGTLAFWWKVDCEPEDEAYDEWFDYATFAVDGTEQARIAGESGWRRVECAVEGAGAHELLWTFMRDDYDEDGADWENALWVDGVEWTPDAVTVSFDAGGAAEGEAPAAVVKWEGYALVLPGPGTLADPPRSFAGWSDGETIYAAGQTYVFGSVDAILTAVWTLKTWTLAEAVDAPALAFATGGTADWTVDTASGWTNGISAKSGAVASGETSWVETTLVGAGTLTFRWKVQGGIYRNNPFAYAKFEVDGTNVALTHLTDGWEEQTVIIERTGTHAVRWSYLRTSARTCDGDCAWLDGIAWTPSGEASVVVEGVQIPVTWLDENAPVAVAAADGDYEVAARAAAANGVNAVWECYVAGISPTNALERFLATIAFDENGFPIVEWSPDLGDVRGYVVEGKSSLEDEWGDWTADSRFFRVRVALPGVFENYTISFDTDGGGEIAPIMTNRGAPVIAPPAPTKNGYVFAGWSPTFPATMPLGGATLIAQWIPQIYTIVFEANGGTGTMSDTTMWRDMPQKLPKNLFVKDGNSFSGWSTNGTDKVVYVNEEEVFNLAASGETVVLRAVWIETSPGLALRYYDNGYDNYSSWIGSESALIGDFASRSFALETMTLEWGETLDAGMTSANSNLEARYRNGGLSTEGLQLNSATNRFHGKYANDSQDYFSIIGAGFLWIDDPGHYEFGAMSDDAFVLYVDGTQIVRAECSVGKGNLDLSAGLHRIAFGYAEAYNGQGTSVQWKKPGDTSFAPIPQSVLFHRTGTDMVTFHSNGGKGEMAGIALDRNFGAKLPVCTFTKTGHSFAGWATNETGAAVFADASGSPPDVTALYATWRINQYSIQFNSNGGSAVSTITQDYGSPVMAPDNPTRKGYAFAGWSPVVPATMTPTNVICIAQWAPNRYTIRFDANGGMGEMDELDCTYDETVPLPACIFSGPAGAAFLGWSTTTDGLVEFVATERISNLSSVDGDEIILFAKWNRGSFTVHFDANGGEGVMPDQVFLIDMPQKISSFLYFRDGFYFAGWTDSQDGPVLFDNCETVSNLAAEGGLVGLYAVWAENIWNYQSRDGSLVITGVSGNCPTNINIPPSIDGVPVTSIGNGAFSGCSGLTSITIPDSVTSIGNDAFSNCSGLTSITIPDSVTSIGDSVFSGCSVLNETRVQVSDLASWTTNSINSHLRGCRRLFANGEEVTKLVVPDCVTDICAGAFSGFTSLTSVELPNSVTNIGRSAFNDCSGITSINIPAGMTEIGDWAFHALSGLTNRAIPDHVTRIGDYAFCDCAGLTSITIPNSVTSIGGYAFRNCSRLASITIPDGVMSIGYGAFSNCSSLTSLTLPEQFEGNTSNMCIPDGCTVTFKE